MKLVAVVILSAVGVVLADEKYRDLDDKLDLSEVLSNDRLLQSYAKCLLNKGPCTPEVKQIKDKIPEVLETHCAKCTDKQKEAGKKLAQEVKKRHPKIWAELVALYDPEGKYQKAFQQFLNN
ncbi:allergen Tha p 1 [Amyelois transitella]|uniref:allergen Tha p 1 n=1 Tax=Amyelois transitella TaxID=680683 RepID=UPI00298F73B6|nr:allergen Tha p 1 [Amyelois transitella]